MSKPTMTMSDEVESLAAELRIRTAERDTARNSATAMTFQRDELLSERNALTQRLQQTPAMREIIAELRVIYNLTTSDDAERLLRALLRRIDLESQ
jgi:hypothetical protein